VKLSHTQGIGARLEYNAQPAASQTTLTTFGRFALHGDQRVMPGVSRAVPVEVGLRIAPAEAALPRFVQRFA
jgi:hypothetical protein